MVVIMKTPKVLYILIAVFCFFAIVAGVYDQFIERKNANGVPMGHEEVAPAEFDKQDMESIKNELNKLFINTVNMNGTDTTGIKKIREDQEIIFTVSNINRNEDAYEININLPIVNINSDEANAFNKNIIQALFARTAQEVVANSKAEDKSIYNVDYVAYVNNNILSLIVKATLKDGKNAQRIIVKTFNYNLNTNKLLSLNDIITLKSLNVADVNSKIKQVIQDADNETKDIQNAGYENVFKRNLEDEMYSVEKSSVYFLGPNSNLYIIYPYGNDNATSEMDVVLFE